MRTSYMRSCKEIVRLVGSKTELNPLGRIEVFFHLMMCKHCSRYGKQLRIMRHNFRKLFKSLTSVSTNEGDELRIKIKDKLRAREHSRKT